MPVTTATRRIQSKPHGRQPPGGRAGFPKADWLKGWAEQRFRRISDRTRGIHAVLTSNDTTCRTTTSNARNGNEPISGSDACLSSSFSQTNKQQSTTEKHMGHHIASSEAHKDDPCVKEGFSYRPRGGRQRRSRAAQRAAAETERELGHQHVWQQLAHPFAQCLHCGAALNYPYAYCPGLGRNSCFEQAATTAMIHASLDRLGDSAPRAWPALSAPGTLGLAMACLCAACAWMSLPSQPLSSTLTL